MPTRRPGPTSFRRSGGRVGSPVRRAPDRSTRRRRPAQRSRTAVRRRIARRTAEAVAAAGSAGWAHVPGRDDRKGRFGDADGRTFEDVRRPAGTRSTVPPRRGVEGEGGAANSTTALAELGRIQLHHRETASPQIGGQARCSRSHGHRGAVADEVQGESSGLRRRHLDEVDAPVLRKPCRRCLLGSSSARG